MPESVENLFIDFFFFFLSLHNSDVVAVKQSQVDKLYAGLKDLCRERRAKLEEASQLFALNREIDDLEQWINEKEVVASSQDLGQDYEHVTVSILIVICKNVIFAVY